MTEKGKNTPTVRFKGFCDDWEQRKLGEIAEIIGGGTPSTNNPSYWDGDIDWYAPAEIGERIFANGSIRKITKEGLNHCSAKILPAYKTVLFTSRAGIGKMAILQHPATTNQGFQSLVCHNDIAPYFVFSMGKNIKAGAERVAAGSTFAEISGKTLSNLEFMFPNTAEQQAIGACFKNIDMLITLHQRQLDEQKALKKYFLQNMFPAKGEKVPRIRFQGFTDDWEERKLGELVIIERGGSPRPIDAYITDAQDGLNWVKIGDAPEQGRYITHTEEKIKPSGLSKTRQVFQGDLILSNSMSFGKPYIMGIQGCIHDGWLLIRNNQNVFDLKFLCQMLGTEQMLAQYRQLAAGSTVNNLNKELVSNAIVKVPRKAEQEKIGTFLESIDNVITLHQRHLTQLQAVKKFMLQNLFV